MMIAMTKKSKTMRNSEINSKHNVENSYSMIP